jgi:nucleobase:cation symporter-1, NCS1 family
VRRRELALEDLYLTEGAYRYSSGWNWRAVAATLAGCALAWGGLVVPALRPLYDYAWFVGFGVAFVLHVVLMRAAPPEPSRVTAAAASSPRGESTTGA